MDEPVVTRRAVLRAGVLAVGVAALAPRRLFARDEGVSLAKPVVDALVNGKLVYVSPLKKDGSESSCHAEVWYFWDTNAVVIATATSGWKTRALKAGNGQARLWVGDFGPYAKAKDKVKTAPSFVARAEIDGTAETFQRLLDSYGARYPDEWGKWKPRFEKQRADGSRTVIRYTPISV
ncbi:MAG TPA: hypothetical protein VMR31_09130 [Myxococcota bacterium]|nr:hypothetical protein [Myxococcota bacterium]